MLTAHPLTRLGLFYRGLGYFIQILKINIFKIYLFQAYSEQSIEEMKGMKEKGGLEIAGTGCPTEHDKLEEASRSSLT